jgi:hypothetical protein
MRVIDIVAAMRKGVEEVRKDPLNKNRDGRAYVDGYESAVDDLEFMLKTIVGEGPS